MNDQKLEKLKGIIDILQKDTVSTDEFAQVMAGVINSIKDLKTLTQKQVDGVEQAFQKLTDKVTSDNTDQIAKLKKQLITYCTTEVGKMIAEHDQQIMEMDDKIDAIPSVDENKIISKVLAQLPADEDVTPEQIRDDLESLQGDNRLDVSAIKGIELKTNAKGKPIGFGGRGFYLYVAGAKKGLAQFVNLVAGSNVTIADSIVNGLHTLTFSSTGGSGGGLSLITSSGTINDSNTAFPFASKPITVVVNGLSYRENHGWSWDGVNATLDNPVGTGGDIYAVSAGITILTTSSTIDDSNVAFVFASLPNVIVVNGLAYRQNHGWSWNSGTLTATLDNPVGTGGDIFGY